MLVDLQVARLSVASGRRVADELRLLRSEWGAPLEATLTHTDRRHGVLRIDGAEHRFRTSGRRALLDEVHAFLHEHVARPQLRPIVLTSSQAGGGPARWTVWPDGSGTAEDGGEPDLTGRSPCELRGPSGSEP